MWLKALISPRLGSSPSALILDRRRPAAKDLSPTPSVAAVSLPPAAPQHPQAAAAIAARGPTAAAAARRRGFGGAASRLGGSGAGNAGRAGDAGRGPSSAGPGRPRGATGRAGVSAAWRRKHTTAGMSIPLSGNKYLFELLCVLMLMESF